MAKTIVGLYDDRATAARVTAALKDAGFTKDHVQFSSSETGTPTGFDVDASTFRDTATLTRYGIESDEARFYGEGVRRGGSLVVVRAQDQDADKAVDIMAEHNPVRYEDRKDAYLAADYSADTPMYSAGEVKAERATYAEQGTQRLQEIQEAIKVGKREVIRGAVRVSQHVETDEVSEVVSLREESVHVDRKNVDRELTAAEADAAFEDKTVEVVARAEEAVVEKTARVVGEVEVGLDASERQETVGGTVRSTHVEVETEYAHADLDDEAHFGATYGATGRTYTDYQPAYGYGRTAASKYDTDFMAAQTDVKRDYDADDSIGDAWDDVKGAVRHGYERAKRAVS